MPLPMYRGGTAIPGTTNYTLNGVNYGGNPFGSRVGSIPMPNPFGDLSSVYPNLSGTNSATSSALLSKLSGELSPDTINRIQNAGAEWGAANGMPGFSPGTVGQNRSLRDIGRTSEQQIQEGLGDYSPIINSVSGTQTVNPALQADVNATNRVNAAAPDPAAAASYAQQLFDKYLQQMRGPAGGTGSSPWYSQGNAGQYSSFYGSPWGPGGGTRQPAPAGS